MSISDDRLRAVLATYDRKSIWYARDILGQRRAAEGLIYDMFDFTANVYTVPPTAMQAAAFTSSIIPAPLR